MSGVAGTEGRPAGREERAGSALARYFSRFDEGEVIRWAFRGLLVGAIGVLALDLRDLAAEQPAARPTLAAPELAEQPVLPPAVRTTEGEQPASVDPRENVTADEAALRRPITFTLEPGGVLRAQGYIDPGAWTRFEDEVAARGEYVRVVALDSPGGSLDDAIGIAGAIRDRGLATRVEDGALCASSCPLVLAGGTERSIGAKAAVGVHQFYAVGKGPTEPAQAMADAQQTTARISRHLARMGVDPALWLHALDTPPRSLYYLSAEELRSYRLASGDAAVAAK